MKKQDFSLAGQGLLTVKEVASYCGYHKQTIYDWIESNEIPVFKPGKRSIRLRQADVDEWLEKRKAKPLPRLNLTDSTLTSAPVCRTTGTYGKTGGTSEMAKAKTKPRYFGSGVYQRITKRGIVRWCISHYDATGKRVQRVVKNAQSEEEALLARHAAITKAMQTELGIRQRPEPVNFSQFSEMYVENYAKPNKRSWKCDDYCLEAHLKPYFGKFDMREISPLDVETYRAKRLKAGVKKSTTNREMALLKKMFHLAEDWGYCEKNPVKKVRLFPERDNLKERVLTDEEEARLRAKCPAHLAPIVVFALYTGMRRGEVLGLRWDQIDAAGKTVRVMRTKSGRDRTVMLNEEAAEVVQAQRRISHGNYVFPSTKGGEFMTSVAHSFARACRLAGITGLRFHDLRHTFATRLIHKGADIRTVQELLGHFAVTVTERYTHTGAEEKRRAVDLLTQKPKDVLHRCDTDVTEKSGVQVTDSSTVN